MRSWVLWGSIFLTLIFLFVQRNPLESKTEKKDLSKSRLEKATFAGGCFWCMEPPFEKLDGVYQVLSGYTGGVKKNPTYKEVAKKQTNHVEAVEIQFDPNKVSYKDLLEIFWRNVDPTDSGGQFVDRGSPYTSRIFYHNEGQKRDALASKAKLQASKRFSKPIVTQILSMN